MCFMHELQYSRPKFVHNSAWRHTNNSLARISLQSIMQLKRSMPCKDLLGLSHSSFKVSGSDSCCSGSSEFSLGSLADAMYKRPRLIGRPDVCYIKTPATAALEASLPLDDFDDEEFLNCGSINDAAAYERRQSDGSFSSISHVARRFSRMSTKA